MSVTYVAPALTRHIADLGLACKGLEDAKAGSQTLKARLKEGSAVLDELYRRTEEVDRALERSAGQKDCLKRAHFLAKDGIRALEELRAACDKAEECAEHRLWPVPKYRELLYMV
jgi:glutamine synthetase